MYRGIFSLSLDSKSRLAIPTRYRDDLTERCGGRLICTVDHAGCLVLYPLPEWERVEQEVAALPSFNPIAREFQRMFLGNASDCEMDRQGRILLPTLLREFAAIDGKVVMSGHGNKWELWNEERWHGCRQRWLDGTTPGEMPEEMRRLSI